MCELVFECFFFINMEWEQSFFTGAEFSLTWLLGARQWKFYEVIFFIFVQIFSSIHHSSILQICLRFIDEQIKYNLKKFH